MPIKLVAEPVVYTNNLGGGLDEIQAPQQGENFQRFVKEPNQQEFFLYCTNV